MPIYEFRCASCEKEFEALIPLARVDDATCPSCGAGKPRRLMSVIAGMAGRAGAGGMEQAANNAPQCGAGACPSCS
jgi:putative FmdB family regulatory protein